VYRAVEEKRYPLCSVWQAGEQCDALSTYFSGEIAMPIIRGSSAVHAGGGFTHLTHCMAPPRALDILSAVDKALELWKSTTGNAPIYALSADVNGVGDDTHGSWSVVVSLNRGESPLSHCHCALTAEEVEPASA
jgi:hypothetical protein